MRALCALTVFFAAVCSVASCARIHEEAQGHDPISQDPAEIDAGFPPSMVAVNFESSGARLNGLVYMANGVGPHPTVILLHGYPGNERNLDLAQAMRRAGLNVIFFHYRGAWGSAGAFSLNHVIEDVGAALEMARQRAEEFRIDPERLILVGHSMGGFAALQGAARDEGVRCVAGLAAGDLGAIGAFWRDDPQAAAPVVDDADTLDMLAGWSGEKMLAEMTENIEAFSLTGLAPKLAGKSVLLVAAESDETIPPDVFHRPMVEAYSSEPAIKLSDVVIPGDHSFSWSRIQLARTLVAWATMCGEA